MSIDCRCDFNVGIPYNSPMSIGPMLSHNKYIDVRPASWSNRTFLELRLTLKIDTIMQTHLKTGRWPLNVLRTHYVTLYLYYTFMNQPSWSNHPSLSYYYLWYSKQKWNKLDLRLPHTNWIVHRIVQENLKCRPIIDGREVYLHEESSIKTFTHRNLKR